VFSGEDVEEYLVGVDTSEKPAAFIIKAEHYTQKMKEEHFSKMVELI
jgi:hypothetical protein